MKDTSPNDFLINSLEKLLNQYNADETVKNSLFERLKQMKSKKYNTDTKDPNEFLANSLKNLFMEYEKMKKKEANRTEKLKKKESEKLEITKAKSGEKACGTAPLGYKWDNAKIVIDEPKATVVKDIFHMYLNGKSLQDIADKLNESGGTGRGKAWTKQTISTILKNDFYIGIVTHANSKREGTQKQIINKITFGKVQAKLKANRKV